MVTVPTYGDIPAIGYGTFRRLGDEATFCVSKALEVGYRHIDTASFYENEREVGRARSGCGAALVGSTDQVLSEIEAYQKMGIRAFIFSGYPHIDECQHFGKRVMPELKTCSLPHAYGRVPDSTPATPLGVGQRR